MDFVTNKIEQKTGMDINQDGHVGKSGGTAQTGGGLLASGGGGLLGKAEQATHMDLNGDGRVGGGAPQQKH